MIILFSYNAGYAKHRGVKKPSFPVLGVFKAASAQSELRRPVFTITVYFAFFTHVFPVIDLFDLLQHPIHYNDRIVLRVISQSGICELILFPERFTLLVAIHITQPDILVTQTVQIHTQLCDDPASNAMSLYRTFHHKESDEAASFRWIMVNKVHHSHKLLGIIKKIRDNTYPEVRPFCAAASTHIIPMLPSVTNGGQCS